MRMGGGGGEKCGRWEEEDEGDREHCRRGAFRKPIMFVRE